MFLRKEQSSHSWAGHRVSGFSVQRLSWRDWWEAERKETALVCENKSVRSDRLDERTGLEKREEALICGNNCYIIHLQ